MVKTLKEYLSTVSIGGAGVIRPMASLSAKGTDIGPKGSRGRGVGLAASTLPKAKLEVSDKLKGKVLDRKIARAKTKFKSKAFLTKP